MDQLRSLVPTMTLEDERKVRTICGLSDLDTFPEVLRAMVQELVLFYDSE